jgi:hypothetical protein
MNICHSRPDADPWRINQPDQTKFLIPASSSVIQVLNDQLKGVVYLVGQSCCRVEGYI